MYPITIFVYSLNLNIGLSTLTMRGFLARKIVMPG